MTPWIAAFQASLSITNPLSLLKLMPIESVMLSHPLSSPSPPAPNPSQHQGLFQWVNSSHEVAKVLEFQLQHQSFQWTPKTYLLEDGVVGSPFSTRDSQESSPILQFKSIKSSVLSLLGHINLLKKWHKYILCKMQVFILKSKQNKKLYLCLYIKPGKCNLQNNIPSLTAWQLDFDEKAGLPFYVLFKR